jgi:acetyl esterase/lipase
LFYAPYVPELTPDDVSGADLSVVGVISYYGPSDLRACYFHTHQDLAIAQSPAHVAKPARASIPSTVLQAMLGDSMTRLGFDKPPSTSGFRSLLGGTPDEVPEKYAILSPVSHVHPNCPPTLLIQGDDDLITPVTATRNLASQLDAAGVPVVNIVFPHTDHAFDLALPGVSPAAQTALFAVERFLGLLPAPCLKAEADASDDRVVEAA